QVCGKSEYIKAIDTFLDNFSKMPSVMIVGEGNQGKTCLLNGLLGKEVAKAGYAEKSANRNYYQNVSGNQYYSTDNKMSLSKITAGTDILELYASFMNQKDIDVHWLLNLEWPCRDICIIDTEGFNQVNAHHVLNKADVGYENGFEIEYSDLFDDIYCEADIVIWCVNDQYISGTKKKYEAVRVYNKPVFLVYTFADEILDDESIDISTTEELLEDMRERLGLIASDAIKDFAGFAGDKKSSVRRQEFINSLRSEIDSYVETGTGTVKEVVGERLFEGIYHSIYDEVCNMIDERYTAIARYYSDRDELSNQIEGAKEEYIKRMAKCLDEINASIPHTVLYERIHQTCNNNYNQAFMMIKTYYDDVLSQNEDLLKLLKETVPETVRTLEDTYILNNEHVIGNGYNRIEFDSLKKVYDESFAKLRTDAMAWGILANWKSAEFAKYLDKLKRLWKSEIEDKMDAILSSHKTRFYGFMQAKYKLNAQKFIESLVRGEWIKAKLDKLCGAKCEVAEYYAYYMSEDTMILSIGGEHNKIYNRYYTDWGYANKVTACIVEEYIHKAFGEFRKYIEIYFESMETDDWQDGYDKVAGLQLCDIMDIPDSFYELDNISQEIDGVDRICNIDRNIIQEMYQEAKEYLDVQFNIKKEEMGNLISLILKQEATEYIHKQFGEALEQAFIEWKKDFVAFLANMMREEPFTYDWYDFEEYLKNTDSIAAQIYLNSKESKDKILGIFFNNDNEKVIMNARNKAYLAEIVQIINYYEKMAVIEKERQNKLLSELYVKRSKQIIDEYVDKIKGIFAKIYYKKLIKLDEGDNTYNVYQKIEKLSYGLTKAEKASLLGVYMQNFSAVEKELFQKYINYVCYKKNREKIKAYYESTNIKDIFNEFYKCLQKGER
ncbi:MAG: hypothetical protein E7267_08280, partial [Lachnospiraceae bacterium]|nr:hypothetical protein [Lachnospiraceae bacterium]